MMVLAAAHHAQTYGSYDTAAVMTFVFPLLLFAAAMLWLYFQRSRR